MTDVKIEGKLGGHAGEAIALHATPLFARLGATRMIVAELKSATREDVAADEDKKQSVKLRIQSLEVANPDQEDSLRQVLNALHMHRTAYGTLTEDGDLEMSASTIERAAGEVNAVEAARLNAGVDQWVGYGRRVLAQPKVTASQLRGEFDTVLKGLRALVDPTMRDS